MKDYIRHIDDYQVVNLYNDDADAFLYTKWYHDIASNGFGGDWPLEKWTEVLWESISEDELTEDSEI